MPETALASKIIQLHCAFNKTSDALCDYRLLTKTQTIFQPIQYLSRENCRTLYDPLQKLRKLERYKPYKTVRLRNIYP